MVQGGLGKQVQHAACSASFDIGCTKHHTVEACVQHGTAAHGTRLQRDIKRAAIQAVIAQSLSRVAQGLDFGVRGRIVVANGGIAPNTNDLPCLDNHCAHWHLTGQGGQFRLFQRKLHPAGIVCRRCRFGGWVGHLEAASYDALWLIHPKTDISAQGHHR